MNNIAFVVDDDGIGTATLDMPGRPFNVFSEEMIDELEALVARVENEPALAGVVVTSGKDAFMAGADLAMVRDFTTLRLRATPDVIRRTFSRLSRVLRRLERVPVPTVAAVDGLALGGGLELAMACHHRIVARTDAPCLGLPEILLGLLPGAGGTQRLPRLTSPAFAARMLMDGRPVTPAVALEAGLADALADPAELLDTARTLARETRAGARWDREDWRAPVDDDGLLAGPDAFARLCALGWADPAVTRLYPAFGAIARCLIDGYAEPFDAGMEVEFDNFLDLMLDPVAGNMVRTSFLSKTSAPKRAAGRLGKVDGAPKAVAVAGAGTPPPRLARRFECVGAGETETVFGLRRVPEEPATGCAVEVRYAGAFDRCEAVEVAAEPGEAAARVLAVVNRLRLVPVAAGAARPGPTERLLGAVRAWNAAGDIDAAARARFAVALDLGRLFANAGLETAPSAGEPDPADREQGLALLAAVAAEAAACLAEGVLGSVEDGDVLAVVGLGFPAWTGGPLSFADGVARGEIDGISSLPPGLAPPYYPD